MHITFAQSQLAHGLATVSRAIPRQSVRHLLTQILLTPQDDGRVRLSATNEQIGIHTWVATETIQDARPLLVPAKVLTGLVQDLPAAPVTLTVPPDSPTCQLCCQSLCATLQLGTEDPAEFPPIASWEQGDECLLRLDAELLKEIADQVAFAAATDDSHPIFTGVCLTIAEGQATFAAADSFRLATRSIPVPDEQRSCTLLIPAQGLRELAKVLPDACTIQVMLTADRGQILFHTNALDLSTRLLEGTFPTIEGLFRTLPTTRVVLAVQSLHAVLRVLAPLAREGKQILRLTVAEQEGLFPSRTIHLETTAPDVGTMHDTLEAKSVEGPGQDILLNIAYLLDVLAVLDAEELVLELTTPAHPIIIKPLGFSQSRYVVMPMSKGKVASNGRSAPATAPAALARAS